MRAREKVLKEQLTLYTTKYEEFQSSLKSSSDIFATYKTEIEKVSDTLLTLNQHLINTVGILTHPLDGETHQDIGERLLWLPQQIRKVQ